MLLPLRIDMPPDRPVVQHAAMLSFPVIVTFQRPLATFVACADRHDRVAGGGSTYAMEGSGESEIDDLEAAVRLERCHTEN